MKWQKHKKFSTGIDRLEYVDLCFDDYKERISEPSSSPLPDDPKSENETSYLSVLKKPFCTPTEKKNYKTFACVGCTSLIESHREKWLRNPHIPSTFTPVCETCFVSVFSTQTKLSSDDVSQILSESEILSSSFFSPPNNTKP